MICSARPVSQCLGSGVARVVVGLFTSARTLRRADSLYEDDMLESVPVAPGEQSNYEQAIAARRMYKQSQRASAQHWRADSAAVAVASWRRRV